MEISKVNNINEVLSNKHFKNLKCIKTNKTCKGQKVYSVTKKFNQHLSKRDQFYLDSLHYDHLEVFNSRGEPKLVLNFNMTVNQKKTTSLLKSSRRI